MSDWKKYVREHLPPLALSSERELEIVEELAQHLEGVYEEVLAKGGSEEVAYERAAALITDWRLLECVNGRYRDLREESKLCLYAPFQMEYRHSMSLLVRTENDPKGWLGAVRGEVRALDRRIPVFNLRSLAEQVRSASAQERTAAALTGLFGVLALLLSAVGVYGVIAYSVAQRTREIGVRMALGAQRLDVLKLMIGEGMKLTLAGAALGLGVSMVVTRLLKSMLFGVSATDPTTLVMAVLVLVAVALLACYIPTRRALKIDAMTTLKYE